MTSSDKNGPPTFELAGRSIHRLGFDAMRITGPGIWGGPADREEAIRTLRRVPELGLDFIDTADSYGPFVSEELIAEALHPYDGLLVATKGGLTRSGPDAWHPVGRPEYLRQCVLMSLRRLKVDRIDLWQLHRIDERVPRDEQFGAIADFISEGLIAHAGISQVTTDDAEIARKYFQVASIQNRYNLGDRADEDVLRWCESAGIGFIPWYPLASGKLAKAGGPLDEIAKRHGKSAGQIALAWLLRRSPVMLPIPGTGRVTHLDENAAAREIELTDEELRVLDRGGLP